jgi:hypothetical protein
VLIRREIVKGRPAYVPLLRGVPMTDDERAATRAVQLDATGGEPKLTRSPDGEEANHCEGDGDKSEIEPSSMAMDVHGSLEQLDGQPDTNRETKQQANDVERRVVNRPDRLVLRHADDERDQHYEADKNYAQDGGGDAQDG